MPKCRLISGFYVISYETRIRVAAQHLQGTHLALPSVAWSKPGNIFFYVPPVALCTVRSTI